MSSYRDATARTPGPAQRASARPQRMPPPKTREEPVAPAQPGKKAVAAGLIGSAALVLPAAAAWASPSSAALALVPPDSTAHTTVQAVGPGTPFQAHTVVSRHSNSTPAPRKAWGPRPAAGTPAEPLRATLTSDVVPAPAPAWQPATAQAEQPAWVPGPAVPGQAASGQGAPAVAAWAANGNPGGQATWGQADAPEPAQQVPQPAGAQASQGSTWVAAAGNGTACANSEAVTCVGAGQGPAGPTPSSSPPVAHEGGWQQGGDHGTGTSRERPIRVASQGWHWGEWNQRGHWPGQGGEWGGSWFRITPTSTTSHVSVPPMIPYEPDAGTAGTWGGTAATNGTTATGATAAGTGGTATGTAMTGTTTGNASTGGTATGTTGGTATGTTGSTTTGTGMGSTTMTGTATGGTTTSSTTGTPAAQASVPVFSSSGSQVGIAVTNPATGAAELIGQGGTILGVVQQQNGAVNLVGAGGAVLGSFALNQATGQVILSAASASGVTGTGTTAGSGTSTTGTRTGATTGTTTSGQSMAATSVPVYDSAGTQVGVVVTNPATSTPELIGAGGSVLGIVQQQNGAVNLVGAGGAVLGSFALNQATGQVVLTAGGGTGTAMNGTTGMTTAGATTTSATTGTMTGTTTPGAMASAAVPVFDTGGIQIGLASTNPTTGAVELVGANGTILGVIAQQNGAVSLVGSGGTVLGSFGVNQATGQVLFAPAAAAAGTGSPSSTAAAGGTPTANGTTSTSGVTTPAANAAPSMATAL